MAATTVLIYTQHRMSNEFYQPPVAVPERKETTFVGDESETAEDVRRFLSEGAFELNGQTYPRTKQRIYTVEHQQQHERPYVPLEEQSMPMPRA